MGWRVIFYRSARGELPVCRLLREFDDSTVAKAEHSIELLRAYGPFLRPPYSKQLSRGLYELRVKGKLQLRIIYEFDGMQYVLLHAFVKKTQRTPTKEIETALARKTKLL